MRTTIVFALGFLCLVFSVQGQDKNLVFSKKNMKMLAPANINSTGSANLSEQAKKAATQAYYENEEKKLTYGNLMLFPIVAEASYIDRSKQKGNYITLKKALEENKATVAEKGTMQIVSDSNASQGRMANQNVQISNSLGSAQVNSLMIHNSSGTDTLFIMAGEVVTGGKQDRVIAQDVAIPPSETTDLSVFCVEKSRWSGNSGNFDGYFSVSQLDLRKVVTEDAEQTMVWDKVDEITTKNSASTSTKTYAAIKDSKETQEKVSGYIKHFEKLTADYPNTVGVLVISGDKVVGCDMFANSHLFEAQFSGLLQSYAMEAVTKGKEVTANYSVAQSYFDQLMNKQQEKFQTEDLKATDKVHLYNYD